MKTLISAIRLFLVMTGLTGLLYPLVVTLLAQTVFHRQANGDLVLTGGAVVGSHWIGQEFKTDRYFWSRPSANGYKALFSGGTNWGPTSRELQMQVRERAAHLIATDPGAGAPPADLLFASGSGLDPEISPEAALYQLDRVVEARHFNAGKKARLRALIESRTQLRQFGVLGEPRVNVLDLNLALDHM